MSRFAQSVHDLPRMKSVPGHHKPAPFVLTKDMFGGIPIEIAGAEITDLIDRPVAELHTHDIPEIYLLVSPNAGGAEIDIEVDGATISIRSPSAVYVPAGAIHRFITRSAEPGSFCFGIFIHEQGGR